MSGGSGNRSTSPWDKDSFADCIFGYTSVDLFHEHTIIYREHHTEKTVSSLIARHSKTMGTPNSIQRPFQFTHPLSWNERIVNTCVVIIIFSGSLPYSRNKRNMSFCFWSNGTNPWCKCHFYANIAEFIRVIYALPGYFDKYTSQSMTVQCQMQMSRQTSHECIWGHHLKYERFRTTLNKNRRDLTGNNFIDHVTKTCSENSP